jgi:uncharacterized coiled-coil protein SlyX
MHSHSTTYTHSGLQEEELEEINNKISAGRSESEEARRKMAQLKASWEEVEQMYRQHKDSISTVAEEAEPIKVSHINMDFNFY